MNILILHGWGQNRKIWEGNISQLSKLCPTKAIDLPGFGNEPLISTNWGIPQYATWVEKYIKSQNLTDVILVGHSFGGRIASMIASSNPRWLKGLVLEGAPCIYRPTIQTRLRIKIYKLLKHLLPNSLRKQFYTTELSDAHNRNLGQIFRNVVRDDQTNSLKNISVPTLLIWGENDEAVPLRIARKIHQLIPQSKLVVIPKATHQAHLSNPNLFYGSIKKFYETLA